jgi:carbamoyl-phosphate synthase/aspartate carbamoyltransferase/dihydroorotase
MLRLLFERTQDFKANPQTAAAIRKGFKVALLFYEASSRTRLAFETAIEHLGSTHTYIDATSSSVKKGESLEDTIATLELAGNVDCIVLRHPASDAAQRAASVANVPVINAGCGDGEHPTQSLVDLYTIWDELGTLGGLCVTLVGDLKHGRTVHSLAKALALREDSRINYVSPESMAMPKDVVHYVAQRGVKQYEHHHNLLTDEQLATTDVLYMTRIQYERHEAATVGRHSYQWVNTNDYDDTVWACIRCMEGECESHGEQLTITPATLAKAKEKMLVLHPLPRGPEISPEIDSDPRAAYMRQMANGPYVRMALLSFLLGR